MADITKCPVCFEEFLEPKILPCSHTLCVKCLGNLRTGSQVTCPMCKAQHQVPAGGITDFPDDQTVLQLIEERKKSAELNVDFERSSDDEEPVDSLIDWNEAVDGRKFNKPPYYYYF